MVHFPATRKKIRNCTSFQRLRFFASNCGYCTSTNNITLLTEPRRPNPRKPIINRFSTRSHAPTTTGSPAMRQSIWQAHETLFDIHLCRSLVFLGIAWSNPTRSIQVPASSNDIQPLQFPASSCFSFNSFSSYWKSVRAYKSQHFLDN